MRSNATVSTTFAATHATHRVELLVTLAGETPVNRKPVNVALVLDRSGSMQGMPLEAAREAALLFTSFLNAEDRLTVVTFDEDAYLVFGPGAGNDPAAQDAIRRIACGGSTNLSAGWLEAHRALARSLVPWINRVVLLTDGQANRGIVDHTMLGSLVGGATSERVTTSCIGFGPHFDENLLRLLSDKGDGHFWYVEGLDQMTGSFEGEIEGLVTLAAQNATVTIQLSHPGVAGATIVPSVPFERTGSGGWKVRLGDLYASAPRSLGVVFHVENAESLGSVEIGSVTVEADLVREDGVEHITALVPVMATLDGQDRVEPTVERAFLKFAAADAREAAVRHADAGQYPAAAQVLRDTAFRFPEQTSEQELREIRNDLLAEAARLDREIYGTSDRKYNLARSEMAKDGRGAREQKLSRRRPPAPPPPTPPLPPPPSSNA